jgi:hypothetical protein
MGCLAQTGGGAKYLMDLDKAVRIAQDLLEEDADNPFTAVAEGAQYNPLQQLWIIDYVSTLTGEAPEGGGIIVPLKGAAYHFTSVPTADEYFGIPPELDEEDIEVASSSSDEEDFLQSVTNKGAVS